jgi:hypothetical protein
MTQPDKLNDTQAETAAFRIDMVSRFRDLVRGALGDITPEDATPEVLELCSHQAIYSDSVSDMVTRSLASLRNNKPQADEADEVNEDLESLTERAKLIIVFRAKLIDKLGDIFRDILREVDSTPATPNKAKILMTARNRLNADAMGKIVNEIFRENQAAAAGAYFNSLAFATNPDSPIK